MLRVGKMLGFSRKASPQNAREPSFQSLLGRLNHHRCFGMVLAPTANAARLSCHALVEHPDCMRVVPSSDCGCHLAEAASVLDVTWRTACALLANLAALESHPAVPLAGELRVASSSHSDPIRRVREETSAMRANRREEGVPLLWSLGSFGDETSRFYRQ
jgi:hypothetical protein